MSVFFSRLAEQKTMQAFAAVIVAALAVSASAYPVDKLTLLNKHFPEHNVNKVTTSQRKKKKGSNFQCLDARRCQGPPVPTGRQRSKWFLFFFP